MVKGRVRKKCWTFFHVEEVGVSPIGVQLVKEKFWVGVKNIEFFVNRFPIYEITIFSSYRMCSSHLKKGSRNRSCWKKKP